MNAKQAITENKTALGIEFGSTRIKAVLIDDNYAPIASGGHDWENRLENGFWTYSLDDVWNGLQDCFRKLSLDVKNRYDITLTSVGAIGFSAMMHGYMAFDKNGNQLVPFRTWRNTTTEKAAAILTEKFQFNIPQRWSIAHLYQAILNGEPHVKDIDYITTLAGFVHWKLTGQKVLGIDDASGMFPISGSREQGAGSREILFDKEMIDKFNTLISEHNIAIKIENILPKVLVAGENAGTLTEEGAKLLDPGGAFKAGVPLCPPEGDAGTGMVATNAVAQRTGNVSAGTSIFAMIVMEKNLSKVYPEIDIVTTPTGKPVAMVHCNNCTGDLDAWIKLLREAADLAGAKMDKPALYDALYYKALEADTDCGGLLAYNYLSGEHTMGFEEGRPLFVRKPDSRFNLANLMRTLLFSSIASLKLGMDILTNKENVRVDCLLGHGGLFKTKEVGQRFMAAALNVPVSVMESAGEGGAWGIALLAAFMQVTGNKEQVIGNKEQVTGNKEQVIGNKEQVIGNKEQVIGNKEQVTGLEDFLNKKVFAGEKGVTIKPEQKDVESFTCFIERYVAGLKIEQAAVDNFK